jgi:hypothetical protein
MTLNRDKCAKAVFGTTLNTMTLGNGSLLVNPVTEVYPYGSVVRITGLPQSENHFAFWGGSGNGTNSPLNFPVTNAQPTVTAGDGDECFRHNAVQRCDSHEPRAADVSGGAFAVAPSRIAAEVTRPRSNSGSAIHRSLLTFDHGGEHLGGRGLREGSMRVSEAHCSTSKIPAAPMPPPMHMVTRP